MNFTEFLAVWLIPLLFYAALTYLIILATRLVRAVERSARSQEEKAKAQREAAEALKILASERIRAEHIRIKLFSVILKSFKQ